MRGHQHEVWIRLYFTLNRVLDQKTVSWVCIVGAAPIAAAGFFQYNGLMLEKSLWTWLKSEVLLFGKRVWKAENNYEEVMKKEKVLIFGKCKHNTPTDITQNVEECLRSDTARMMLANCEFLLMFNQTPTDRVEFVRLLETSDSRMDYVDTALRVGLIKVGVAIVPFANELPEDTELYRLMTTKSGDK